MSNLPELRDGTVSNITDDNERVIIYLKEDTDYHVVASRKRTTNLRVGDVIEYEPYGANFGWLSSWHGEPR